jgi:secondary thiamine-phosphate synthase enzyme
MKIINQQLSIETTKGFNITDITDLLGNIIQELELIEGILTICSMHTTTAITINENEERLLQDLDGYFNRLVPEKDHYLHNDLHLRDCPPDEPENAHSHIQAILIGQSVHVRVVDGKLALGKWQSVLFCEFDGPRERTVGIQFMGR